MYLKLIIFEKREVKEEKIGRIHFFIHIMIILNIIFIGHLLNF